MKKTLIILFLIIFDLAFLKVHSQSTPYFTWGNANYFNLNVGEKISFQETEITLLEIQNHYNLLQIGNDSVWLKVSRRSPAEKFGNNQVFVADNKNVKALANNSGMHGLLIKDAMICISDKGKSLVDENNFIFPVSFNDGFLWGADEDSYLFSYINMTERNGKGYDSYSGIDFDLHDARGINKHKIIAIENSEVVWIEDKDLDRFNMEANVLLESESQPGIYYLYKYLNKNSIEVKKGQRLGKGDPIGTIWGDEVWGSLHFTVIRSDTVPALKDCNKNIVNCFPQIFQLYFKQSYGGLKYFSRGRIFFGKNRRKNGNEKNASAYESYTGKGWILGKWNVADKVENITKGDEGNIRLNKTLFRNQAGESTNPNNWFEYEIDVSIGVYRIRAKVGDIYLPTWQRVSFENVDAGSFENQQGEFKWTPERVVRVNDGRLTIRIYIDETGNSYGGLSEIVFQKAG